VTTCVNECFGEFLEVTNEELVADVRPPKLMKYRYQKIKHSTARLLHIRGLVVSAVEGCLAGRMAVQT
jgi:hypothetical protein